MLKSFLVLMIIILSSFFAIQVANVTAMPIGGTSNRIVVEFKDNIDRYSHYLSSKYDLPIVGKNYDGRFVVFQVAPDNVNLDPSFRVGILERLRHESVAQSAHYDYYVCMVWIGGCGGGGSCSPYFSLSASTPAFYVGAGQTQVTSILMISSVCGYSGPVYLGWQSNPCPNQVSSISFSPSYVMISGGSLGNANSTVQFVTPPSSSYPVNPCVITLVGSASTSGPSNTLQVSIAFNDFTINANPSSSTILAGTSTTSTISVTALGPGPSTISLMASVSPNGPSVSVNPATLQLPGIGNTGTSTLTISTVSGYPGNYVVTVTGSSGSLTHAISLSVSATFDFGVTVTKTSLTLNAGLVCDQSSYVTVSSVNGASGNVALSNTMVPNGPSLELRPYAVVLPSYGSVSSNLYVCAATTASGTFTATITATIGSVNHAVTVSVIVPFPGDPFFGSQSGLTDLNVPNAWKITAGAHRTVIAIVDSGIQLNHPDLQGNLWTANGFADGTPNGVHGFDSFRTNFNPVDTFGHGTAVAGVAAAVIDNGIGIAGVGNELLMAVKVGDNDQTTFAANVAIGIDWARNHGANIINMSFGTNVDDPIVRGAVDRAWNAGLLLIAAVGNNGINQIMFPAAYGNVIPVSGLQNRAWCSTCSNYGTGPPGPVNGVNSAPELSAPGWNVLTTNWGNASNGLPDSSCRTSNYCSYSGTSFAAPFVAGLAALAWDYNIQKLTGTSIRFTNTQMRAAMDTSVQAAPSSRDITAGLPDYYGFGVPDAQALLQAMITCVPGKPC